LVNQWGRDGNFSSSGSRSSGGGIVIAAIVALLLGGGGGYTAARLFSGVSAADVATRDGKIADLEKQISDLKFKDAGNSNQENVLRERVEELTKANETLKALADENDGKASADAQAEIAALKKTIEEAGDVRAEFNRARRSLQVAELQIIDLEGEIKTQRGEIDKLRASLTDSATKDDAGNAVLRDQIRTLETALTDSRKQAAAAVDLRKRLATMEDDLAEKTGDLSKAQAAARLLRATIDKDNAELVRLKKDLSAALAANKDKAGESEALQKRLSLAEQMLAASDAKARELATRAGVIQRLLDDAKAELKKVESDKSSLSTSLEAVRASKKKLEREVATLKETIVRLQAARPEDKPQPDATDGGEDTPTVARRDADDVRDALKDMPGFGRLTPDKQIELARRLEDGACVNDALNATLGRVPAIALRNLIRDLGSKC